MASAKKWRSALGGERLWCAVDGDLFPAAGEQRDEQVRQPADVVEMGMRKRTTCNCLGNDVFREAERTCAAVERESEIREQHARRVSAGVGVIAPGSQKADAH